eukprot:gene57692-79049_t
MRGRGGHVLLAAPEGTPGAQLPLVATGHEDLDAIAAIQSFYPMVEALARARGYNPDLPRHLSKAHLAQPHMAARIPVETLSPNAARQQSRAMCRLAPPGEAVARTADFCIPGPYGGMIPVRMYTPAGMGAGPMPVCLYFHGGGWVLGDLDAQDAACRSMANGAACVVVSVNYRHAPEHPFPAAPEDCYAAACWVARQGAELGMDPQRLAVAGMSAGANLAIAVTLMAKERG